MYVEKTVLDLDWKLVIYHENLKRKREIINLSLSFRWVMYVEKTVCDVDGKLVIYHENLKKLKRKLEIIQQMCDAPRVYVSAVVEVVRRRHFSQHFLRVSATASTAVLKKRRNKC